MYIKNHNAHDLERDVENHTFFEKRKTKKKFKKSMEEKKEESKKIREWTKTYRLLDRKLRTMMIKTLQQNTTETKKREPSRGIARARAGLKKLRRVLQKEDVHDDAYLAKLKNAMDRTEMAILTFKENQKREWVKYINIFIKKVMMKRTY